MSDFASALVVVLRHEGGYVNDPADAGGETNLGISMRFLQREGLQPKDLGLPGAEWFPGQLIGLTQAAAAKVYETCFWNRFRCGEIRAQVPATKVFDCFVNMLPATAATLIQRAVVACGVACGVDGKMGPETVKAVNACEAEQFAAALSAQQRAFYLELARRKPSQEKFLKSWLRRAAWPHTPPGEHP